MKATAQLGLDKATIPSDEERRKNWEIFKKNHFPTKLPADAFGEVDEKTNNPLREGPQPGSNAYKNMEKYAMTTYGALMIKKVNDGFQQDIKNELVNPDTGESTRKARAIGHFVFRIGIVTTSATGGAHFINLPADFVPAGKTFTHGGQIIDPLAIIHHEFEHTRFGVKDHTPGSPEDEIAAVKLLENPVRALNGHEPRYTYTEMKGGNPVQTINIVDTSQRVKGGTTYCKNDPSKLVKDD